MANIRKSFNFRNGVQVDNDNFVVNPNGLVGIGTSTPSEYFLNVYGDKGLRVTGLTTVNNVYVSGGLEVAGITTVGFITANNAHISGVLTVTEIDLGNGGISNLVGYAITDAWVAPDSVGLVTTRRIGIGTDVTPNQQLGVTGDANITGIVTAASFVGNASASELSTGTIPDARFPATLPAVSGANLTNLNGSNISSGTIAAARVATLNQNTTGTAGGLTGTPDITVGSITGASVSLSSGNVSLTGSSGNITATGSVGIGTTNPTQNLTIKDTGSNATLEIIAPNNRAQISVGQSVGLGNSSSLIRFNDKKLEFINYDVGSVDSYIHQGTGTGTTGNFRWIYGQTGANLMTLTYDGNLGINDTSPEHKLSVGGISTFTGNAHFDGDVTVVGNLNASVTLSGVQSFNINATSGISTFAAANITGSLDVGNQIGINTTSNSLSGAGLDCLQGNAIFKNVGVGTTAPKSAVDFSDASGLGAYMIPPKLSTVARNALVVVSGGMIYNTDLNKLQFYNGTGWETVTSS